MKRDKLESYLGKYVKIILFDRTAIEGILHKTSEKAFENDLDLSIPKQRYFCTDENGFISSRCLFRVSHIKTFALAKMTNFEKIKQMTVDEMARSCIDFLVVRTVHLMLIAKWVKSLMTAVLTAQSIGLKAR